MRLRAVMRRYQGAEPGAVDEGHVVHVQHDILLAAGDQAFHFFAKGIALFAEHNAPIQPHHCHAIHFEVRHFECHVLISSLEAGPAKDGPAQHISNSRRTISTPLRLRGRSAFKWGTNSCTLLGCWPVLEALVRRLLAWIFLAGLDFFFDGFGSLVAATVLYQAKEQELSNLPAKVATAPARLGQGDAGATPCSFVS